MASDNSFDADDLLEGHVNNSVKSTVAESIKGSIDRSLFKQAKPDNFTIVFNN